MRKLAPWIAIGFGAGRAPVAPGTWGSLLGLAVAWLLWWLMGSWAVIAITAVAICAGLWALGQCGDWAAKDSPEVVIDEIAGQALACWPAAMLLDEQPWAWMAWIGSFAVFRALDIFKPGPIRMIDQIGGKVAVMADDLMAGAFTAIVVAIGIVVAQVAAL